MANITVDGVWTSNNSNSAWGHLTHHLRVLARAYRIGRKQRARVRLIRSEMRDPRWFADIGIDARRHRRYDWLGAMALGMTDR